MKPVLKQWFFDVHGGLYGHVWYDDRFPTDYLIHTTPVVKLEKGEATTKTGTVYILGTPCDCKEEIALHKWLENENNPD